MAGKRRRGFWKLASHTRVALVFLALAAVLACVVMSRADDWAVAVAKREAMGRKVNVHHLAQTWCWRVAVANVVVLVGFAVTARHWLRAGGFRGSVPRRSPFSAASRGLVIALCLLTVLAGVLRAPRLGLSLYNDEVYAFTHYVAGSWRESRETGELEPRVARWSETLWLNESANNAPLQSVASRLFYEWWRGSRWGRDARPLEVAEVPVRLPVFVAGTASVPVVGLAAASFGGPLAGIAAATYAAVHPWHIRYSTEARAYGFVFLAVALLLLSLPRALATGQWRWWSLVAVCEVFLLGSYLGGVYFLLAVNLALLVVLLLRIPRGDRDAGRRVVQLLVSNALAAMLFLQLFLPNLLQVPDAVDRLPSMQGGMSGNDWWGSSLGGLITGLARNDASTLGNSLSASLTMRGIWQHGAVWDRLLLVVALVVLLGLGVRGAGRLLRRHEFCGAALVTGSLLSVPLMVLASELNNTVLHPWYVVFAVPVVTVLVGMGVGQNAQSVEAQVRVRFPRSRRLVRLALLLSVPLFFAAPIQILWEYGKEDLRGMVEASKGKAYLHGSSKAGERRGRLPVLAGFWTEAGVYDPEMVAVASVEELKELLARARMEQRELYLTFTRREMARRTHPELVAFAENPTRCELVALRQGFEESQYTNYLYRVLQDEGGFP